MGEVINPFILYAGVVLGGLGVLLALPRKRISPQVIGGLLGALGVGVLLIGLGLKASPEKQLPNVYFYVFAAVALGGCLRVITHPRPVYAALYFILTILASAGMYLILAAEFMAFALIIIYAGAILITYIFVIMLATQAPAEDEEEAAAPEYDQVSREPALAAVCGFVLLAALSTMVVRGVRGIEVNRGQAAFQSQEAMERVPRRLERALHRAKAISADEAVYLTPDGLPVIDMHTGTVVVARPDPTGVRGAFAEASRRSVAIPSSFDARNVESLAFDFLNRHPGAIELAGVILLMAMLGAVVLSRRQVEPDEEAKANQSRRLSAEGEA